MVYHCYRSLTVIENGALRKQAWVRFSIRNPNGPVLYNFRDKARYWSKIRDFYIPLHSTPPLGRSPSEYCHNIWYGETRIVRLDLRDSEKKV